MVSSFSGTYSDWSFFFFFCSLPAPSATACIDGHWQMLPAPSQESTGFFGRFFILHRFIYRSYRSFLPFHSRTSHFIYTSQPTLYQTKPNFPPTIKIIRIGNAGKISIPETFHTWDVISGASQILDTLHKLKNSCLLFWYDMNTEYFAESCTGFANVNNLQQYEKSRNFHESPRSIRRYK